MRSKVKSNKYEQMCGNFEAKICIEIWYMTENSFVSGKFLPIM